MSERAYRYRKGQESELIQIPPSMMVQEEEARIRLVETLADRDDALLEKLLDDVKPTPDELYRDMHKDLLAGTVIEVREDGAILFDFNHPLAGQPVSFEVQIIGVL
jgi:elongation factor G